LRKLGKYELVGELGRGGMGIVYLARDPILGRLVALKSMSGSKTGNPNLLQAFYHEARLAGSLQHPNIVKIWDVGEQDGIPFIVMEFMDGQNLDRLIASRVALPLLLKLIYGLQACRAIDYAHKRGVIHRDIKPSNVMVNKAGTVTVVDFGIARVLGTADPQSGMLAGTCAYIAPEVYGRRPADERSDIWSFGVLLYELLACRRPFSAESVAALTQSICFQEPIPIAQLVPDCPPDLQFLVQRMLLKSEAERLSTMEDVLLELDSICKRLQTEELAKLFEQSRKLVEQGEFEQASDLLFMTLQIENSMKPRGDYTKGPVRAFYEKVLSELLEQSRRLVEQGEFEQTRHLLVPALQIEDSIKPTGDYTKGPVRTFYELSNIDKREVNEPDQKPWTRLKVLRTLILSGTLEDATLACSLDELIKNLGLDPLDPHVRRVCEEAQTARNELRTRHPQALGIE
jgi:serine/threonine protein kinase